VTLLPRFREPKVCPGCSTETAYHKYEGNVNGNYITPNPKSIKDLVLMERFDEISWICVLCARARAVETIVPLWWVDCKTHGRRVSLSDDLCVICEEDNKDFGILKKKVKKLRGED
jgi:hypothetical protein